LPKAQIRGDVWHYEADPLADDLDDEKRIKRAKKASKEMENTGAMSRKQCGGSHGGGYRRRHPQWMEYDYKRDSYQPPSLMATGPQYQHRPQMSSGTLLHLWRLWPPGLKL